MKAKSVNFQRGIDPKDSMSSGLRWKRDLDAFVKAVEPLGVKATYKKSEYGLQHYEIKFENLLNPDSNILDQFDFEYITKETADEEGWGDDDWGFAISGSGEEIIACTKNINQVVKKIAKWLFGISVKSRIISKRKKLTDLQKEIEQLEKIEEYISSLNPSYLR